jgi:DnaJ homolog subfamily C member 28
MERLHPGLKFKEVGCIDVHQAICPLIWLLFYASLKTTTEVESAARTFREILRQSWQRHAIRILTMAIPPSELPLVDATRVAALRDSGWEVREKSYHDAALKDINDLVRKYNGLAPYAVRKPYYTRETELARVYAESCKDILEELAARVRNPSASIGSSRFPHGAEHIEDASTGLPPEGLPPLQIWRMIMSWLRRRGTETGQE